MPINGSSFTHVTKDGEEIPLPLMTHSHLMNMINRVLGRAEEVKARMADYDGNATDFQRALRQKSGQAPVTPQEAATTALQALEFLYPYLAELLLRGDLASLNSVGARLRRLLEREPVGLPMASANVDLPVFLNTSTDISA